MYDVTTIATAVGQFTGEALEQARRRVAELDTWGVLIPSASAEQALLESLFLGALGAAADRSRPCGVHEAIPASGQLTLRVESDACVQRLLEMLPFRDKRGVWRGVRDLRVQSVGNGLRFTLELYREETWRKEEPNPLVVVRGPHEAQLAELLHRHRAKLEEAGCRPQWEPKAARPTRRRREPLTRNVLEQHKAACQLASALLRRPRLWDALAGHVAVQFSNTLTDHGLDWSIERTVSPGTSVHDDRLEGALTDRVVGPGLRLLNHECTPDECVLRFVAGSQYHGWSGILTVQSRGAARPNRVGRSARPLVALGEPMVASRPRPSTAVPDADRAPAQGHVIALMSFKYVPGYVDSTELEAISVQMGAVWAVQGHRVAVLTIDRDHALWLPGRRNQVRWATEPVPRAEPQWTRLRIDPTPGQLWGGALTSDAEAIKEGLDEARRRFDRVLVVDGSSWSTLVTFASGAPDAFVFALGESGYERELPRPMVRGNPGPAGTVALTPTESAVKWRERELKVPWLHQVPLAGALLLRDPREEPPVADEFTAEVEEQLARYGTPILGRYPRLGLLDRAFQSAAVTVLDPAAPDRIESMTSAATALGDCLWPCSRQSRESMHG